MFLTAVIDIYRVLLVMCAIWTGTIACVWLAAILDLSAGEPTIRETTNYALALWAIVMAVHLMMPLLCVVLLLAYMDTAIQVIRNRSRRASDGG